MAPQQDKPGSVAQVYPDLPARSYTSNAAHDGTSAVDGSWTITMKTPAGERSAVISLKSSGPTLTGTQAGSVGPTEIFDGRVNGDDVSWKIALTKPISLTLAYAGKIAGDTLSGKVGVGTLGTYPFTATRLPCAPLPKVVAARS